MRAKGIIYTGLSALLYGLAPVLSAKTYQLGSDALTLTFYRELLVLPLLLAVLWRRRTSLRVTASSWRRWWRWGCSAGGPPP